MRHNFGATKCPQNHLNRQQCAATGKRGSFEGPASRLAMLFRARHDIFRRLVLRTEFLNATSLHFKRHMDIFARTYPKDYRFKRCAIKAIRLNVRNTRFDPGDARDTALRCVRFRDFMVRNRRATSGGKWTGYLTEACAN